MRAGRGAPAELRPSTGARRTARARPVLGPPNWPAVPIPELSGATRPAAAPVPRWRAVRWTTSRSTRCSRWRAERRVYRLCHARLHLLMIERVLPSGEASGPEKIRARRGHGWPSAPPSMQPSRRLQPARRPERPKCSAASTLHACVSCAGCSRPAGRCGEMATRSAGVLHKRHGCELRSDSAGRPPDPPHLDWWDQRGHCRNSFAATHCVF